MYYFTHPEPYHLRPVDPLLVILGCQAILTLRERIKARKLLLVPEPVQVPAMN
jgi:hypothetical protein